MLKAVGSAAAIALSVTMYHRSLRSFLPDKKQQGAVSSVVYFLWNMTLLASRLTALALFASVLPCFVLVHFLCWWLVLVFLVWRSQTSFMSSAGGEWLYRATVGLIWYFDWLSVGRGRTRFRTLVYHGSMVADISVLCGLWFWKTSTEPSPSKTPQHHAAVAAVAVVMVYFLGLLFKMIYYKCFHPNLQQELRGGGSEEQDETDSRDSGVAEVLDRCGTTTPPFQHCNQRMRVLAQNFYS